MVDQGSTAPSFTLPVNGGDTVTVPGGERTILYFYPKDDTPGCTTEAKEFTEHAKAFADMGVRILGCSPDTVAKHEKFTAKHELDVPLIADEEHVALEAYGVWVEKSMYGKTYMGVERSTFLIDADGTVLEVWRKVRVKGHVAAVLEAAKTHFAT
ncbi:MAG: peroxiredoxin [Pseudomonadota bacterium]